MLRPALLATMLATACGGCGMTWLLTQATGHQQSLDEGVRDETVPLDGIEERLTVTLPLIVEHEAAPTGTTAPAKPFALGCSSDQRGQDAVYHQAFRYGASWKKATAIAFLVEGLAATAIWFLEGDRPERYVYGGYLGIDALVTGAIFFIPRKEIYRRDVRPVTTEFRTDCPETLTLDIAGQTFPVDAAGRLGELGDAALDDWMQAPTGPIRVGHGGQSVELVIDAADRCLWNQQRQRAAEPSCPTAAGPRQQYATVMFRVAPGTLTRVAAD